MKLANQQIILTPYKGDALVITSIMKPDIFNFNEEVIPEDEVSDGIKQLLGRDLEAHKDAYYCYLRCGCYYIKSIESI